MRGLSAFCTTSTPDHLLGLKTEMWRGQGSTILTLVAGAVDNADNFFRRLITSIAALLTRDDVPVLVKSLGIK